MKKLLLILSLFLLYSCNERAALAPPYIVLDIEGTINSTTPVSTLNDYFDITQITKIETSDSLLLGYISIVSVNDSEYVLRYKDKIHFIDKKSGKLLSSINRKGRGPGEYMQIMDVCLDNDGNVIILGLKSLLKYTRKGELISTIQNDSLGVPCHLDDQHHVVSYPPHIKTAYSMGVYDKDWKLIREGIPNDTITKFRMLHADALKKFNNECYYRQLPLGDTIFHVTHERDTPYIVLNKGRYKAPSDIYGDLDVLDRESPKYVTYDYVEIIGNLLFYRFSYNDKYYSDIWDIKENKLIYRGVISREGGIYGIPLMIEGQQIDVWPSIHNNKAYIELEPKDAMKFMDISEDDNSKISLKIDLMTNYL